MILLCTTRIRSGGGKFPVNYCTCKKTLFRRCFTKVRMEVALSKFTNVWLSSYHNVKQIFLSRTTVPLNMI